MIRRPDRICEMRIQSLFGDHDRDGIPNTVKCGRMRFRANLALMTIAFSLFTVSCQRTSKSNSEIDSEIMSEVQRIPAIDNHAHPARATGKDEKPDRDFDALPVDNMEPQSDPLHLRPTDPDL